MLHCPVSEARERVSWAEFLDWIAYFQWRHDQQTPAKKRILRPRSPRETAISLLHHFRISPRKTRTP